MNRLILLRTSKDKNRTIGKYIVVDKYGVVKYTAVCLELPDLFNQKNISCIPEGKYPLVKVEKSQSFNYPHFKIDNVPNRTFIKIHRGNFTSQI